MSHYDEAVGLLLQRYLSYYIDWTWASQCNPETHSGFMRFEYVHKRLLAGDKRECVYEVAFRYPFLTWEAVEAFPEELAQRARWARIDYEDGAIYYAYFHWTVEMRMVKDYVFELEGIAETGQVLAAFREQYGGSVLADVPALDLADELPGPGWAGRIPGNGMPSETRLGNGDASGGGNPDEELPAEGNAAGGAGTDTDSEAGDKAVLDVGMEEAEAYQTEVRENALWVSGGDGVLRQVPVRMEELLTRGDDMDRQQASLPAESFQVDQRKQIFAYGGAPGTPLAVVYYDEETGGFRKSVVSTGQHDSRRIFVDFPEDGQEGFLISTGGRVVWQEGTTLFRTGDGGETWEEVGAAGPDIHSLTMDADFMDSQVGFVAIRSSEEPDIWRTADAGEHWEKLKLPYVPEGYSIAYAPELQGEVLALYVGMEDYSEYDGKKAKYESGDGGQTWEYKGFVLRK